MDQIALWEGTSVLFFPSICTIFFEFLLVLCLSCVWASTQDANAQINLSSMQLSACELSAYVLIIIDGDIGPNEVANLWASTAISHSIG